MAALNSAYPKFSCYSQVAGLLTILAMLLSACGEKAPAGGPGGPLTEVGVVTVTPHAVGLTSELPGRLEASRVAQVRARAAGILLKRLFREDCAKRREATQEVNEP